ncbi:hypothetical protein GQ54DRAFT_163927 [Martensiomyces pterosporus]|nr:hypothetical protein GQ54DRAFT_163927 [Martensiomyces pterosporus]
MENSAKIPSCVPWLSIFKCTQRQGTGGLMPPNSAQRKGKYVHDPVVDRTQLRMNSLRANGQQVWSKAAASSLVSHIHSTPPTHPAILLRFSPQHDQMARGCGPVLPHSGELGNPLPHQPSPLYIEASNTPRVDGKRVSIPVAPLLEHTLLALAAAAAVQVDMHRLKVRVRVRREASGHWDTR